MRRGVKARQRAAGGACRGVKRRAARAQSRGFICPGARCRACGCGAPRARTDGSAACDAASFTAQINPCAQCETQCRNILNIVDTDVLSVETEVFTNAQAYTKSTVSRIVRSG